MHCTGILFCLFLWTLCASPESFIKWVPDRMEPQMKATHLVGTRLLKTGFVQEKSSKWELWVYDNFINLVLIAEGNGNGKYQPVLLPASPLGYQQQEASAHIGQRFLLKKFFNSISTCLETILSAYMLTHMHSHWHASAYNIRYRLLTSTTNVIYI